MCIKSGKQGTETIENYTKKKNRYYKEQNQEKIKEYVKIIEDIPKESIAYVDETGIDTYIYREYGYAPKGKSIKGFISGCKYKKVEIVAAKLGKKVIEPLEYSRTMSSKLFELWFEEKLLLSLPKNTVIVMVKASFHRKKHLLCTTKNMDIV